MARPIAPGALIASRYEVLRELGAGGMGRVFEAHDRKLDLRVAVKTVRASSLGDETAKRFRSEIKLAWKVRHKNVASIHEYGEDGDLLFISMELVDGWNLRQLIQERGPFLWEEGYDTALQIGDGLEAIHEAGVIHRDLKSANVMIEPSGRVRVMDFGIAKAGDQRNPGLTDTGQVVGSPEYMSPEQVRGWTLDFRSDLYAFGIVIYEIFSGRVPFRGDSPVGTMLMQVQDPPPLEIPAAAQIPAALVEVLRRALAKDPARRPGSCREMNAALRAAREALERQVTDAAPASAAGSSSPERKALPTLLARAQASLPAVGRPTPEPAPPEARLLVPTLIRALGHAEPDVRASAARSLASVGPAAGLAVGALGQALQDPASDVRFEAIRALDSLGSAASGAFGLLDSATRDTDPRVQQLATATLARLAPAPAPTPPTPVVPPPIVAPAEAPTPPLHAAPAEPVAPHPSVEKAEPPAKAPWLVQVSTKRAVIGATGLAAVIVALWLFRWGWSPGGTPIQNRTPMPTPTSPQSKATPAIDVPAVAAAMIPPPPATTAPAPPTTLPRRHAQRTVASPSPPAPEPSPSPAQPPSSSLPEPPEEAIDGGIAGEPVPMTLPPADVPATPTPLPAVTRGELVQIGETGVTPPEKLLSAPPEYPAVAVRRNAEGVVELRLLVDEDGRVAKLEVVKAVDLLTDAAVEAVRRWTFRPARKHGVPVKMWIAQPVEFRLAR